MSKEKMLALIRQANRHKPGESVPKMMINSVDGWMAMRGYFGEPMTYEETLKWLHSNKNAKRIACVDPKWNCSDDLWEVTAP